jgi:hypothetical protein
MSKTSTIHSAALTRILGRVEEQTKGCQTLEQAAQVVTNIFFDELGGYLALARVFATVPFGELPASNRTFVTDLAATNSITPLIKEDTLILSLLGTRGVKPEWNDRHKSQGHVGIPLASASFVEKIPMISRLLKQVGLDLNWIDSEDTDIVTRSISGISGVFYVQDAAQAVDNQGRKIIPAQDFVSAYNVRTVFGLAVGYPESKRFVTIIVFCRETLDKDEVELFSPLIDAFKASTASLVFSGSLFG